MKVLIVDFGQDRKHEVPITVVAEHYATHFEESCGEDYDDNYEAVMEDDETLIEWVTNNMNVDDLLLEDCDSLDISDAALSIRESEDVEE